jgi:hypothetical protein
MPKDAFILSEVRERTRLPALREAGRYSVARLIEKHGDAKLTDCCRC